MTTPSVEPPRVLTDVAEALRLARSGHPVRLSVREDQALGLVVRDLIPRDGGAVFEIGLGGGRFEVVLPAGADLGAALTRAVTMVASFPPEARKALRRLTFPKSVAERAAFRLELAEADGAMRTYAVTPGQAGGVAPGGCACPTCHLGAVCTPDPVAAPPVAPLTYVLSDGTAALTLSTAPDSHDDWEVAQTLLLWSQLPPSLRGVLRQVHVVDGANPTDEAWSKTYNVPGFVSAASGGNGAATFWHGTKNLTAEYFFHEFGHVIGQALSRTDDMVPEGWDAARQADGNAVSNYGQASINEDFAEAFFVYVTVKLGGVPRIGDPPTTLAEFEQRFPRRAAILNEIFRGDRRPVER